VDALLAALVLVAACLLASFPTRASDVWMHLATGRSLAQSGHAFGTDPFAYTTAGAYWVHHAWLYDLMSYGLYETLGGAALVGLKALLVTALCGVLLSITWRGRPRWVGALCVALALLALGPHLLLRPAYLSYLFLGLTLWGLERAARSPPVSPAGSGGVLRALPRYAPLLALFVLWVNVDEWFLLGPLTVALYALGRLLERRRVGDAAPASGPDAGTLGVVAAAGLALCLVNPHGVRAFTLPAALAPAGTTQGQDEAAEDLNVSPFERAYFRSAIGLSPGGLAYFPLVLLGLASFASNPASRTGPRALVWGAMLLLSVYRSAAIPFFAVVAGPITALNFQDYVRRRAGASAPDQARPEKYAGVGQLVSLVTLLGLVIAAWPGWLQPGPFEPRRWAVEVDPALEQAARQLASWREEGRLGAGHGFNFAPALAHYCAWFAPAEKSYCDDRAHLFPEHVKEEYLAVRRALLTRPAAEAARQRGPKAWRSLLRKARVTHLTLYDPSARQFVAALHEVSGSPEEWQPLYLRGRVLVLAWRDPDRMRESPGLTLPRLDLAAGPFHPSEEEKAPAERPAREPRPRRWWQAFWEPLPVASPDRDESLVGVGFFDAMQPVFLRRHRGLWEGGLAAATVGAPALPAGLPGQLAANEVRVGLLRVSRESEPARGAPGPAESPWADLAYRWQARFLERADRGPPGALLLGIRAARRALGDNPDDALSHLLLGQTYLRLLRQTRERPAAAGFPELYRLRSLQVITSLKYAVLLKDDLTAAHEALAVLYLDMKALDLALEHMEKLVKYTRSAGRRPGESALAFARRLEALEERLAALGKEVREATNRFETHSFGLDVLGKAQAAERLGLHGKALELLLNSTYTAFGREGAALELQLLLSTGRSKELREWMKPEQVKGLGVANYHWLQALLAAATGDYVQAQEHLRRLKPPQVDLPELGLRGIPPRQAGALLVGQLLLAEIARQPFGLLEKEGVRGQLMGVVSNLRQQANVAVLRGVLALEQGESEEAARLFREGLASWDDRAAGPASLARHYLDLIEGTRPRNPTGQGGGR
jgi:hypothetical protein